MTIQDREAQILRVKASSFHPELDAALEDALRTAVVSAVKTTLENGLRGRINLRPRQNGVR